MNKFEIVDEYLKPTSILDIGANNGQFYRSAVAHYPNAYFYLIEGTYQCEQSLKSIGVDYSISLLSDTIKTVNFYTRKAEKTCTGNSIYREDTHFYSDTEIDVESRITSTLNILLPGRQFDLIKMDVQGSELDIIKGGVDIVKRSRGLILEVPVIEYNKGAPKKEEIDEYLASIGFKEVAMLEKQIGNGVHCQTDILYLNAAL